MYLGGWWSKWNSWCMQVCVFKQLLYTHFNLDQLQMAPPENSCWAAVTDLDPRTTAVLFPFRPLLLTALTGLFWFPMLSCVTQWVDWSHPRQTRLSLTGLTRSRCALGFEVACTLIYPQWNAQGQGQWFLLCFDEYLWKIVFPFLPSLIPSRQ